MNCKRLVILLALVAVFSVPARAGSLGVYGSYWDSDQATHSAGAGARLGFTFVKFLELDFHGTSYPDFKTDIGGQSVDVRARPVDGGLRVNFLPGGPLNPFAGAGVTYYFLDTSQGSIQSKTGIYGQAGLEFGGRGPRFFLEALWRKMETHLSLASFDTRTRFDGFAANAGFTWRWGT